MRILFLGGFPFPFGSASAARIRALAVGLHEAGAVVRVAPFVASGDGVASGEYRGVAWESWAAPKSADNPFLKRIRLTQDEMALHRSLLKEAIASHKIDAVIVYTTDAFTLGPLIDAARQSGAIVVADLVEWRSAFNWKGGWLHYRAWSHEWCMRRTAKRLDGVCGISGYITDYFARSGLPALRIPATMLPDEIEECPLPPENDPVRFGYFGTWSIKDGVMDMFAAILEALAKEAKFEVVIAGKPVTPAFQERMNDWLEGHPEVKSAVRILGRVPDGDMQHIFGSCHAFLLFQRDMRYSRARFPQKFAEYMGMGRPVIASACGDIPEYCRDGIEGFMAEPGSIQSFADAIVRFAKLPDKGAAMGRAARARALEVFDARRHGRELLRFLEGLVEQKRIRK